MALLAYSLGQGFVPARHRPAVRYSGEFPNSPEVIPIPPGRGGTRKRAGMMPGPGRTMGSTPFHWLFETEMNRTIIKE